MVDLTDLTNTTVVMYYVIGGVSIGLLSIIIYEIFGRIKCSSCKRKIKNWDAYCCGLRSCNIKVCEDCYKKNKWIEGTKQDYCCKEHQDRNREE